MKSLLWGVCCLCAVLAYFTFHLNKENAKLKKENTSLVNTHALCSNENAVCQENLDRYHIAFETIKKKYPKISFQYDLLINGISPK